MRVALLLYLLRKMNESLSKVSEGDEIRKEGGKIRPLKISSFISNVVVVVVRFHIY